MGQNKRYTGIYGKYNKIALLKNGNGKIIFLEMVKNPINTGGKQRKNKQKNVFLHYYI